MAALDVLRLVLGAGFLGVATVRDLRTRRVSNSLWIAFASLAALLFLADLALTHHFDWVDVLASLGVIALAYVLWYLHLLAGGADAKALMALGVLLPERIDWTWNGHLLPLWGSVVPGAIVVLANSVLLFALAPLGLFAYNLGKGQVGWPTMFLGYQMALDRAEASFVWIVDRVHPDGTSGQVLFPSVMTEEEYAANVARLRAAGRARVWVTPKIPFMLPLLLGFLTAFFVGDVMFTLVRAVVLKMQGA